MVPLAEVALGNLRLRLFLAIVINIHDPIVCSDELSDDDDMATKRIIKKIKDPLNALQVALTKKESGFPLAMVEESLKKYFNETDPKEARQWLKLVSDFYHHVLRSEGDRTDASELTEMEEALDKIASQRRDLGKV